MNITDQLKELEKKAKEADYWKDRYDALAKEVENAAKGLSECLGIKKEAPSNGKRRFVEIDGMVSNLTRKLESLDGYQVSGKDIERELTNQGYETHATNISKVRNALLENKNIKRRKEGLHVFLYWEAAKDKSAGLDLLKNAGKTVVMG